VIASAQKIKNAKIVKKAQSLKERVDTAIAKGTEFKLKEDAAKDAAPKEEAKDGQKEEKPAADAPSAQLSSEDDHKRLIAPVEAARGDICCYLIFNNPSKDARVESLFAKPPRFQRRAAIEREEAMGADKIAKASA